MLVPAVAITASPRSEFGKGAARKLRRAGQVPAVIYGSGAELVHVTLPAHELGLALRTSRVVFAIDYAGATITAKPRDVQRDPVRQIIEHIDLIVVKKGERVQVEVPVHVTGESAPGTISNLETVSLLLEVEATHIPQNVVVDIEGRGEGAHIFAADVVLPKGATLVDEADVLIVGISVPAGAAEDEAAADDAE